MTCLEAQSKIIAYIENKLEKEDKIDFLKHIQSCEDCKEELNIYYTMLEGMKQLDNNLPLSKDFTEELNLRMKRELKFEKKKREFFHSSVCIMFVGIFGFLIVGYINFLNLLHEDEQKKIKEAQGDYYYTETFQKVMFEPNEEEHLLNINVTVEEKMSFYDKIREFHMLQ